MGTKIEFLLLFLVKNYFKFASLKKTGAFKSNGGVEDIE